MRTSMVVCQWLLRAAAVAAGLEEEAQDLATQMFAPGLLMMVHDPARGGHHHVAELAFLIC